VPRGRERFSGFQESFSNADINAFHARVGRMVGSRVYLMVSDMSGIVFS